MFAFKKLVRLFFALCAAAFAAACAVNAYMVLSTQKYVYSSKEGLPQKSVVIVLGAKVYADGRLSTALKDRVDSALSLVELGKSDRLLLSGDHGRRSYDEVNAAKLYVMRNCPWLQGERIFLDHAGFSTYETMYRAKAVFCVDDAIIVTQAFHAARAAYIARKLGINAVVYAAEESTGFRKAVRGQWACREFLARVKSFALVAVRAKPAYLGAQIPISGDGTLSWD